MQMRTNQDVYKAVRNVTTQCQGLRDKVRSNLFEADEIAVLVFDDVRKEPTFKEGVRPKDI